MRLAIASVLLSCAACGIAYASTEYKVVDSDDIRTYWIPQKQAHPAPLFPRSVERKHMDVCVSVGFTIESDGTTKNAQVLRSHTSKPYDLEETQRVESAALNSASRLRYTPASGNSDRKPVATYAIASMSVALSDTSGAIARKHDDAVRESCRVDNFTSSEQANKIKNGT